MKKIILIGILILVLINGCNEEETKCVECEPVYQNSETEIENNKTIYSNYLSYNFTTTSLFTFENQYYVTEILDFDKGLGISLKLDLREEKGWQFDGNDVWIELRDLDCSVNYGENCTRTFKGNVSGE